MPKTYKTYHTKLNDLAKDIKDLIKEYQNQEISDIEFRQQILTWAEIGFMLDEKKKSTLNVTISIIIGKKRSGIVEDILKRHFK